MLKSLEMPNGEVLTYRERGDGPQVVVLIHGNMTSSKHWDDVMDKLSERFKVYAMDMRGFGYSTYKQPIHSLKDFAEDIKCFVDGLRLKGFTLVGWSTGGGVAMQFTADYSEYVTKLILIESVGIKGYPFYLKDVNGQPIPEQLLKTREEIAVDPVQVVPVLQAYATKNKEFLRNLWNMAIYTQKQPSAERYEEYLEDMLTQRNLVDVDYALATFNISTEHNGVVPGSGDVDKITISTLVVQGDKDLVVPLQMAEEIQEGIGDNARLVVLSNSGHSPLVDNFEKLIELIIEFTV